MQSLKNKLIIVEPAVPYIGDGFLFLRNQNGLNNIVQK